MKVTPNPSPLHICLPQTMTVESLAQWITENAAEKREHEEQMPLTDELKSTLEHKVSLAASRIQELREVEKVFKDFLNKGTPVDIETNADPAGDPLRLPQPVTIPPTKGLKEIQANLDYFTKQLRNGYSTEKTLIFLIPFPEEKMMIGVDIEGKEWPDYTREMSEPEKINHEKPILEEVSKETKKKKRGEDLEIDL